MDRRPLAPPERGIKHMRLNTIDPTRRLSTIALGALLVAMVVASGCDKSKSTGGQDSGTGPDAATQNDGATGTDGTPGQDGAGQPDAATHPDGGEQPDGGGQTDGAIIGDGGTGDLVISFDNIIHWANCMPIVPPDPWHLSFDLIYDNTAGSSPVTVNIVHTDMVFNPPNGPVLDINVNPTTSGVVAAGASVTVNHNKTSSNNDIQNDCGLCPQGNQLQIEVTVNVGGQLAVVTSQIYAVQCAF